jgi:hypothetical protein
MAYIFPVNPFDGQLYPIPATPGALQYIWNEELKVWLIYSPLGVQSVTGLLPIIVSNGTDAAVVSIRTATPNTDGSMSAADKAKLDNIPENANIGTVTSISLGSGLLGNPDQIITTTGEIGLAPATKTSEGGVIVGDNIDVSPNGTISVPTARFGVQSINVGSGLVGNPSPITSTGTISAALATRQSVGSVRVGAGIDVQLDGTISVAGPLTRVNILAYAVVYCEPLVPVPTFRIQESYNVASVEWNASEPDFATPFVRVTFTERLPNVTYGFTTGTEGGVYFYTPNTRNPNKTFILRSIRKSDQFINLALTTFTTDDWPRNLNNNILWNNWIRGLPENEGSPFRFSIAIIDTPTI